MTHPSGSTPEERARALVARFSAAGDTLDTDALSACFPETFLVADSGGARPIPRELFLQSLPQRARMFADAGVGPAELGAVSVQVLDDNYLLVRTDWAAPRFNGGQPVPLSSSFLLHDDGAAQRVVLYLNHRGLEGR